MSTAPRPFPDTAWGEVVEAIASLPDERQRQAMSMYYEHDMNHAEIAAVLGCTEAEAKRLIERACEALKPKLEPFRP